MVIIRELFWLSVMYNVYISCRHVQGVKNTVTDLLSHVSSLNLVQPTLCSSYVLQERFSSVGIEGQYKENTQLAVEPIHIIL